MKKLIFIVFLLFSASYSIGGEKRYDVPLEDSPAYGPPDAQVTIKEFLDYQ